MGAPSLRTRRKFLCCRREIWVALFSLVVVLTLRIILLTGLQFETDGDGGQEGIHLLDNASSMGEVQALVSEYCRPDASVLCQRGDCASIPNPILSLLYHGSSRSFYWGGLGIAERCDAPYPSIILSGLSSTLLYDNSTNASINSMQVATQLAQLVGTCLKRRFGSVLFEWCHEKSYSVLYEYDTVRTKRLSFVPGQSVAVKMYGPSRNQSNISVSKNLTGLETSAAFQTFKETKPEENMPLRDFQVEFRCCSDNPGVEDPLSNAFLIPLNYPWSWDQEPVALVCTSLLCPSKLPPEEPEAGKLVLKKLWTEVVCDGADIFWSNVADEDDIFLAAKDHAANGKTKWDQRWERFARVLIASFVDLFCNQQARSKDESDRILAILNERRQTAYSFRAGVWNKSEVLEVMREATRNLRTSETYIQLQQYLHYNLTGHVLALLQNPEALALPMPRSHHWPQGGLLFSHSVPELTGTYRQDSCLMEHFERSTLISEECSSMIAAALPKIQKMRSSEMKEFQASFGWFVFGISIFVLALQYCYRRSSLPGGYIHANAKRERQRGRRRLREALADDFLRQNIEASATKAVGTDALPRVIHKLQVAAEEGYNEDGELLEDRDMSQRRNRIATLFHHLFVALTFLFGAITFEAYLNALIVMLTGFILVAGLEAKDIGGEPSAQEVSELMAGSTVDPTGSPICASKAIKIKENAPAALEASSADSESFPNEDEAVKPVPDERRPDTPDENFTV